jgi:hypothetical protein
VKSCRSALHNMDKRVSIQRVGVSVNAPTVHRLISAPVIGLLPSANCRTIALNQITDRAPIVDEIG